jgi:hypothetical protein
MGGQPIEILRDADEFVACAAKPHLSCQVRQNFGRIPAFLHLCRRRQVFDHMDFPSRPNRRKIVVQTSGPPSLSSIRRIGIDASGDLLLAALRESGLCRTHRRHPEQPTIHAMVADRSVEEAAAVLPRAAIAMGADVGCRQPLSGLQQ